MIRVMYRKSSGTGLRGMGAGNSFVFFVGDDYKLYATGVNNYGQLGLGNTLDRTVIERVGSDTDWKSMSCGNVHSIGIKTDGTLWGTGNNVNGALGLGDTNDRSSFTKIGSDTTWMTVACGSVCSYAIKTNGTLWVCGSNENGRIGLGTEDGATVFTQIGTDNGWVAVYGFNNFALALKSDGSLWGTGSNWWGQLGLGDNIDRTVFTYISTGWNVMALGDMHSVGIKTDGTLWATGENGYGQLCQGNYDVPLNVFTQIGVNNTWSNIESGQGFISATDNLGQIWGGGQNGSGQLGIGDTENRNVLIQVGTNINQEWSGYPDSPILNSVYPHQFISIFNVGGAIQLICSVSEMYTDVQYGSLYMYAPGGSCSYLLSDGVWTLDSLSEGDDVSYLIEDSVPNQANHDIYEDNTLTSIYFAKTTPELDLPSWIYNVCGYNSQYAVKWDGVYATGSNWYGELGIGSIGDVNIFTKVNIVDPLIHIRNVKRLNVETAIFQMWTGYPNSPFKTLDWPYQIIYVNLDDIRLYGSKYPFYRNNPATSYITTPDVVEYKYTDDQWVYHQKLLASPVLSSDLISKLNQPLYTDDTYETVARAKNTTNSQDTTQSTKSDLVDQRVLNLVVQIN